jgi:glycerophosphoryl diester phosphodiesterase
VVSSFDLDTVDAVRAHAPEIETGFLVHGHDVDAAAVLARARGHQWLHPDRAAVAADRDVVDRCHRQGLRVDVWTVDDPAEISALAAARVDAVITNVPDVALAVLERA